MDISPTYTPAMPQPYYKENCIMAADCQPGGDMSDVCANGKPGTGKKVCNPLDTADNLKKCRCVPASAGSSASLCGVDERLW